MFLQIFKHSVIIISLVSFAFSQQEHLPEILDNTPDSTNIYESSMSFKGNTFGGLLITKRTENKLRITMTSKFGMKIFDFLLSEDSIQTLYVINQLDKKIIKRIFYNDFRMLYPFLFRSPKIKFKDDKIVLRIKCKKYKYFKNDNFYLLIKKGNGANRVEIVNNREKLDELEIIHSLIGLKIEIKPLILLNE